MAFWLVLYPALLFLHGAVRVLKFLGRYEVRGEENLPSFENEGPIIFMSNHPSAWETGGLIDLSMPYCLRHPLRRVPWSTPDEIQAKRWIVRLVAARSINVPRGKKRGQYEAFRKIVETLKNPSGATVIIFPEGGQTKNGNAFLHSPLYGKRMARFKPGLARIISSIDAVTVVPIWVEEEQGPVLKKIVKIGVPIRFHSRQGNAFDHAGLRHLTYTLEAMLLEVADSISAHKISISV